MSPPGHAEERSDEDCAARVMARLAAGPLPRQCHHDRQLWPSALLGVDFSPSWPRLAALAGFAALGFVIGFAGLESRSLGPGSTLTTAMVNADPGLGAIIAEPEPLTGVRP